MDVNAHFYNEQTSIFLINYTYENLYLTFRLFRNISEILSIKFLIMKDDIEYFMEA